MTQIITSPEQRCKHCLGTIWFTSNISKKNIKCPTCKGTGLSPKSEWPPEQDIVSVPCEETLFVNKKWWQKLLCFPRIFKKKYEATSKLFPTIFSFKLAFNWTLLILFPIISSWIINEKNEDN